MRRRTSLALAIAALLGACGGGTVVGFSSDGGFFLNVVGFTNGFTVGPAPAGQPLSAVIRPGQSIEFDAGVPVTWSVTVNGGATTTGSATFVVGGLSITTAVLGPSRISVDTALVSGMAAFPATLVLTAVAQADARQAATITLQIR